MANVKLLVDIEANSAKLVSEVQKANKSLDGMKKSATDMQKSLSLIKVDSIVNLGREAYNAAKQIFAFTEMGARVKSLEEAFVLMGRNSGVAVGTLIDDLKKVTMETVDDSDLMIKATRMMAEGFSGEQIVRMGEMARATAKLTGVNVSEAYDKISDSIMMLRAKGLKSAGIVIDLDEAYRKHGLTLGVTKDRLSEYGKQMALFDAVSKRVLEIEKQLGLETKSLSEEFQTAKATWKDVWETIAKGVSVAVSPVLVLINLTLEGIKKVGEFSDKIEKWKYRVGLGSESRERAINEAEMLRENPALKFVGGVRAKREQIEKESPEEFEKRINKLLELNKDWRESLGKQALVDERMAWADLDNELTGTMPTFEQIIALNKALKEVLESSVPVYEAVREDWGAIGNELMETAAAYGITVQELLRIRDVLDSGIKDNAHFVEGLSGSYEIIEALSSGISSAWSTNMTSMIKGTQSFGETMKNIFTSMADAVVSSITKMIANMLLFGNISGGKNKAGRYGGLVGWVGSLFGLSEGGILGGRFTPIRQFAGGGVASRPTLGMVGEGGGPEAVVPLRNGGIPVEFTGQGSGGSYTLINIQATDMKSFEEQLKKNPNAIVEIIYKNARGGGAMKDIVRSMT